VTATKPGPRGWSGRAAGEVTVVAAPDRFRAPSNQVCGMWPFAAGTGAPIIGVPLGRHLRTALGTTVCCDPISWFQKARLISNPSEFVLGLPALGKSSLVRRQCAGLHGFGVNPVVLGDLKPDYVDLIRALDGQVITLGPGRGHLNVLDPGDAKAAADRLANAARKAGDRQQVQRLTSLRAEVLAEAHTRRKTMLAALMTILRAGVPPTDREESIIGRALHLADERAASRTGVPWAPGADVPVIEDLLEVIREAPQQVRQVAIDRGSMERYQAITESLEATLVALSDPAGRFGDTFARHTTTRMRLDQPVAYDVSSVDDSQLDFQAAVLLACWSQGFGAINIANVLADAGLEPRRHYFVVMDELWRPLRSGRGMVDKIDALSRLNRQRGVGVAMITHTMSDLQLIDAADTAKAYGLVERVGVLLCAGLPTREVAKLREVVRFSRREEADLTSWTNPPAWDSKAGREAPPPGRGKFLIKVGGRPGIPVQVTLTQVEQDLAVHDTNKLWHTVSRIGKVHEDVPA
jgi:hypothetical protein